MRYVILFCSCIGILTGCSEKPSSYYWKHPQVLRDALSQCQQNRESPTCKKLSSIGYSMNTLGQELQANPQAYGKTILNLQMELAKERAKKQHAGEVSDQSTDTLEPIEQEIEQRLAVIKWLESPEK